VGYKVVKSQNLKLKLYFFHLNHVGYKAGGDVIKFPTAVAFHLNHVGYKGHRLELH